MNYFHRSEKRGQIRDKNPTKVRNDRLLGCFGLFFLVRRNLPWRQHLPDSIKINLNILSAFSVNLNGLMNGHFVDELVEDLRGKFGNMQVFPYQVYKRTVSVRDISFFKACPLTN